MPDPELLALADRLRRDAEELRALVPPVRAATGPDVVAGGRFAASIDELIEFSGVAIERRAQAIETVAAELVDAAALAGDELADAGAGV